MLTERVCPYCKEEVCAEETVETEWDNNRYFDTVIGHCPKCNRKYLWTDVYEFEYSQNFKEIKA